jgi:hypothetical protein
MSWVFPEGNPHRTNRAEPDGFDKAQVCRRGHRGTLYALTQPITVKKFCTDCGAPMVDACEHCGAHLRGVRHIPGVLSTHAPATPSFCYECGKPYPWTEERLSAAREFALELEGLSSDEREQLSKSLDDIVADTPRTSLAVVRMKKMVAKVAKPVGEAFYKLVVDISSETAKKMLTGQGV